MFFNSSPSVESPGLFKQLLSALQGGVQVVDGDLGLVGLGHLLGGLEDLGGEQVQQLPALLLELDHKKTITSHKITRPNIIFYRSAESRILMVMRVSIGWLLLSIVEVNLRLWWAVDQVFKALLERRSQGLDLRADDGGEGLEGLVVVADGLGQR